VALLAVRSPPPAAAAGGPTAADDLYEGLAYAWRDRAIRALLGLVALVSLLGVAYVVLLPVLAREVLHGDARTLGLLSTAAAFGALAGAIYLALRSRASGLGGVVGGAAGVLGLGLASLSVVNGVGAAIGVMSVVGGAVMVCTAGATTLLHALAADAMRGRVMSLYATAFVGMVPLGSLLAGCLAAAIGPADTLLVSGAGCVLAAVAFLAAPVPGPDADLLSAASGTGTRASPSP
jgi:MFS family permease